MSSTLTLPAIPALARRLARHRSPRAARAPWYADVWHVATIVTATITSILAAWSAYVNQTILLYADAHSHLAVARRVIDNIQPGLAQLGSVWLPLPHIILLPLVWNNFLWSSGLAGTLTSMPCYVVAATAIFLTIRRLTRDSRASFVGALVFMLNPNILYLQSTPLSEPVLFATLCLSSYFFLLWAQAGKARHLLLAALCTMLATIARYDGWPLYLGLLVLIAIIGWQKHSPRAKVIGDMVLFGVLGGLGIALWFLWNLVLYGNPLYFASGPFSSQVQTAAYIHSGIADTDHNLWRSIWTYGAATAESIGPVLFALGVVAVVLFTARRRFSPEALAALTFLIPFPFYILAFFTGQDVMYVPYANHPPSFILYNARFGAEMAAPAAVFLGVLAADVGKRWPIWQAGLAGIILVQQVFLASGGVISLQDGQVGASCYAGHPIVSYLAQHYDGGEILVDLYQTNIDFSPASITYRDLIFENDGAVWHHALADPAQTADWVITKPGDPVAVNVNVNSVAFLSHFTPVMEEPGQITLWRRDGLPPLPDRPAPSDILTPYLMCANKNGSG